MTREDCQRILCANSGEAGGSQRQLRQEGPVDLRIVEIVGDAQNFWFDQRRRLQGVAEEGLEAAPHLRAWNVSACAPVALYRSRHDETDEPTLDEERGRPARACQAQFTAQRLDGCERQLA